MTEYDFAEKLVDGWDMESLIGFAVNTLALWYEENPEVFKESLTEWELEQ